MSSIWTPSGEHVPHEEPEQPEPTRQAAGGPGGGPTPEELAALAEIQDRLRATPAIDVIANHVVALFELAVVYLGVGSPPDEQGRQPAPDLDQAGVAVDAMAALVEGLGARLGPHEQPLREGLTRIRMLYVEIADAVAGGRGGPGGDTGAAT